MEELLTLPGVGRKTANVVLGDAFNIPGIVVDTHAKRLSNRLGLTKEQDPTKIEFDLMKIIPRRVGVNFLINWCIMDEHYVVQESLVVNSVQ